MNIAEHINSALFRRNNKGQPCYWFSEIDEFNNFLYINHGIVGKTNIIDKIKTNRPVKEEQKTAIHNKRKIGYKYIWELKDNNEVPNNSSILQFLNAYLPYERTTGDGILLPMLAKVYDNSGNKLFQKCSYYFAQWKINGLRCFISAYYNTGDLFKPISLRFQSREGTIWRSLNDLEEYLLHTIPDKLLNLMLEEEYVLDGELYLPGHTVNEINHFVKDPSCKENKLIQYWCYDIAIQDTLQYNRFKVKNEFLHNFMPIIHDKNEHLAITNRLISLPTGQITNGESATKLRDRAIELGFEGAILRNPDKEYQYGARNLAMIKYKRSTDGKFEILEIKPEGFKRPDIPIFVLKNDINNATFEVHVGGTLDYQRFIFKTASEYIGKKMFVEYGERSGIEQVPFHVKETYIIDS